MHMVKASIELGGTFNFDIKLQLYLIINYWYFGILETGWTVCMMPNDAFYYYVGWILLPLYCEKWSIWGGGSSLLSKWWSLQSFGFNCSGSF